jgi:hypothetical protein
MTGRETRSDGISKTDAFIGCLPEHHLGSNPYDQVEVGAGVVLGILPGLPQLLLRFLSGAARLYVDTPL